MSTSISVLRQSVLGTAAVVWLACFAIATRLGTWVPFALGGPVLAAVSLFCDPEARALLRPSWRQAGLGLAAGCVMLGLTHAAFATLTPLLAGMRPETARLFALFRAGDVTEPLRAALITVIAASEEVIFRGALLGPAVHAPDDRQLHAVEPRDLSRVLGLAALYALSMLTSGSGLLVGCAFACAIAWGALRVATRSLVAPIVAHVVWDVGVLLVWPLIAD